MEDGFEPGREVVIEAGHGDGDHAEADGRGDDHQIHVVAVVHLGQGADAAGRDRAEQHDAGAAEYRGRYRGDDPADDRQQAERDEDQAAGGHDIAALHAGDGHQADVLGECALGEGAEQRRDDAGDHVGAQTVTEAFGVDPGVDDVTHGENVGRGFHQDHHHHDQHRDDRRHFEYRHAEVQWRRKRQHRPFADPGKVGHAECQGDQRADHHGQQNRQSRDGGAAHLAQQKHGGQGKGGQADIGHAAEVGGLAVAAHGPAGGYRHQSKADGGDDDAGDERREELGDLGEDGGDQQPDHRCAYDRTEHYRQPAFAIAGTHYRHDGGDACERHALYQWQLAAEEGYADGL